MGEKKNLTWRWRLQKVSSAWVARVDAFMSSSPSPSNIFTILDRGIISFVFLMHICTITSLLFRHAADITGSTPTLWPLLKLEERCSLDILNRISSFLLVNLSMFLCSSGMYFSTRAIVHGILNFLICTNESFSSQYPSYKNVWSVFIRSWRIHFDLHQEEGFGEMHTNYLASSSDHVHTRCGWTFSWRWADRCCGWLDNWGLGRNQTPGVEEKMWSSCLMHLGDWGSSMRTAHWCHLLIAIWMVKNWCLERSLPWLALWRSATSKIRTPSSNFIENTCFFP